MLSQWRQDINLTTTPTYTHWYIDRQGYQYIIYVSITSTNNLNLIKIDPDGNLIFKHEYPTFNTQIDQLAPKLSVDVQGNIDLIYLSSDMINHHTISIQIKLDSLGHTLQIKTHPPVQDSQMSYQIEMDDRSVYLVKSEQQTISWSSYVTNRILMALPHITLDDQSNIYITYSTKSKIHIHQFDPHGTLLRKYHVISDDEYQWSELVLNIDEHQLVTLSYIDLDHTIHYYRWDQNGNLLDNYHQQLTLNHPQMKLDQFGNIYLMTVEPTQLIMLKMKLALYLSPDTMIAMDNQLEKPIQDICIGDHLSTGQIVRHVCYGLVTHPHLVLLESKGLNTIMSDQTQVVDTQLSSTHTIKIDQPEQFTLYNLQIYTDQETYYLANGMKIIGLK